VACPLCGKVDSKSFTVAKDYNWGISGSFFYLRCTDCGLVFQNTKCLGKKLSQLYPKFYGTHAGDSTKNFEGKINTRANTIRAKTLENFLAPGAIFDVGCGSGFFLEFMRRRGWDVSGLDPAEEHVTFATDKLGLDNVSTGIWPLTYSKMRKVDVVSFLHVIEHLTHPTMAIAAAKNMMVPGGLLLIETPNIKSWPARIFRSRWVALDAPRHLNLFSPDNLQYALKEADFEILYVTTYSPSTMEYSDSLRYALADLNLYRRFDSNQNIDNKSSIEGSEKNSEASNLIQRLKQMCHHCERSFIYCINGLAALMGSGCNILLLARAV
jgi:2-polyprenyl-3-methyl-5-hydroxy-6-metoxy-1,4-benzoquinol methylase